MDFLKTLGNWFLKLGSGLAGRVLGAVTIAVAGYLVIRLAVRVIRAALERSKLEKAAHSLILSLVRVVCYALLAMIVASALGLDVTGVVALASVATLAVSLSVQNMLSNVIGGFTLLYTHPFSSGDFVEIAGQSGTVREIGIAYTQLTTPDNKRISIPNSAVVATQIVNYTVTGTRRVDIAVSASYDSPSGRVIETLLAAAKVEGVLDQPEPPFATVTDYGDSAVQYVLRFWTANEDFWAVRFAVLNKLKADFDAAGLEMTYPHLNVHLEK